MKVLWFSNVRLAAHSQKLNEPAAFGSGWITGALESLVKTGLVDVTVCAPGSVEEILTFSDGGISYVLVPEGPSIQKHLGTLVEKMIPEVVHIFGAEHTGSLAMLNVSNPTRTVVHIQGLLTFYIPHFYDGIPKRYSKPNTKTKRLADHAQEAYHFCHSFLYDLYDSMASGIDSEQTILAQSRHVIGRTRWDQVATAQLAPNAEYHHNNETLQSAFYGGRAWDAKTCKKHSIFFTQSTNPIKGFHQLLKALPHVVRQFPNTAIYVGGHPPSFGDNATQRRLINRIFEYQGYLQKLIYRHNLQDRVHFVGPLDAKQVRNHLLECNVFVNASSIENSSNAIGEAMITGTPVVASNVGGTPCMLTDGEEGLLFPFDDPKALENCITKLFSNAEMAAAFGGRARRRALITHDPDKNAHDLLEIYKSIVGSDIA